MGGPDALDAALGGDLGEGAGGQVGQLGALEVGPQALDRVQLGGLARQPLHHQPGALAAEPVAHRQAAVGGQAVPHQGGLLPAEEGAQLAEAPTRVSEL